MERHYGMDWLRIGAFGLLIFYHIGMFFVPWGWHVKTADPIDAVAIPMLALNPWRLGLLFVVSGFASRMLLAKSGGAAAFARNRSARLLIPLVFGVVLVIPPQPWVELMVKHSYAGSLGLFWLSDYFRFGPLGGIVLPTWQHLWFVVYLWVYTMLLAGAAAALPQAWTARVQAATDRLLSGWRLFVVPFAFIALFEFIVLPDAGETHALVDDWGAHAVYLPMFLFGFMLGGAQTVWETIRTSWRGALGAALAAYAIVAAIEIAYPGNTPAPDAFGALFDLCRIVQGWGAIVALLGIADRYWNRDHPWRATLTEAVFPFYIVHQTIIVVAGWYLLRFALHPLAEFAILLAATVAGCWLFYDIGRRIGWLRPLIGLRPGLAARSPSARGAARQPG